MKQLVILSGKGGTGKTCVAAAFAHLAYSGPSAIKAVLADADVDAANLELVLQPHKLEEHEFFGGAVAVIDEDQCQGCGTCEQVCRFEAVHSPGSDNGLSYRVDPIACDGCAACVYQCPEQAIHMEVQLAGRWFHSHSRFGPLLHAELLPAQENSGKLVTLVKQQARLLGLDSGAGLLVIDGPPGIGCPVISAAAGADLALIVAEPTAAGIHDMDRVLKMARHFNLPGLVVINKADLYPDGANHIEDYCRQNQVRIVGRIPFDETVSRAMISGEPVTAYRPRAESSLALIDVWQKVSAVLVEQKAPL
jgi:MinD superfamily P-loop ATPase